MIYPSKKEIATNIDINKMNEMFEYNNTLDVTNDKKVKHLLINLNV